MEFPLQRGRNHFFIITFSTYPLYYNIFFLFLLFLFNVSTTTSNNNKSKNKIISSPLILGGRAISGHYGNGLSNGGSGHYGYGHIGPYVRHPQTTLLPLLLHRYSYCFFVLISHLTNISFYFINIIGASAEASSWNPSPTSHQFFSLRHLSYLFTFHLFIIYLLCPNSSWCTLFFYVISI